MRYSQIKEYRLIPPQTQLYALSIGNEAPIVGNIMAGRNVYKIYCQIEDHVVSYGAVLRDISSSGPKCTIGFQMMSGGNALMAKNAWTDPDYRKIGLASELMHFVNKLDTTRGHQPIFSDIDISPDGEALWNSLVKSGKFSSRVHDFATHKTYDLSEIDGVDVLNPKQDCLDDHVWNGKTGQRFFYLLETKKFTGIDHEGNVFLCEGSPSSHQPFPILQPYSYFEIGDD